MKQPASLGSAILGENDPLIRSIVRSILLQIELEVFPAADGEEAVQLAGRLAARIVLLDIGMPRMNGLLACRTIRAMPGYAAVPIIILTGYTDDRMREAAREVGADEFMTKPFRPDQLLHCLSAHLGLPGGARDTGPADRSQLWTVRAAPVPDRRDNAAMERGLRTLGILRAVSDKH
jgi:DNA-binding response OmpR family regulator